MLGRELMVMVNREGGIQRPAAQSAAALLAGHQLRELATIEPLARCGGLARISGTQRTLSALADNGHRVPPSALMLSKRPP